MENNRRTWIIILVVIILIWVLMRADTSKIPILGASWDAFNAWFKGVTGISLEQIVMALIRLIIWVAKFIVGIVWTIIQAAADLVRK